MREPSGSSSLEPDVVRGLAAECGQAERHFNELQSKYRALASTWLLASLGGTGFALSVVELTIPVPREWLIAGIAAAGVVGIVLLWMLDLVIYQRLLEAYFWEGIELEKLHPWLPQVRRRMLRLTGPKGVGPRVRLYYVAGVVVEAAIAAMALGFWAWNRGTLTLVVSVSLPIVVGLAIASSMHVTSAVGRNPELGGAGSS